MGPLDPHIFIGVDLGQRRDPAAIAILLRTRENTGEIDKFTREWRHALRFDVLHVQRWPLLTPYTLIVDDLQHLASRLSGKLFGHWPVGPGHFANPHKSLIVDATGVGLPVVELIRNAGISANLYPLSITGADKPNDGTVPRRDLISNLRILLEKQLLLISDRMQNRQQLIDELLDIQDQKTDKADDIAIALCLAAWQATRHIRLPGESQ